MPRVAIAAHQQPNAFATGRNAEHAVVCVTRDLMQLVNRDEAEGVIAHELGHIRNRDMLLQTTSATMASAITNLARFGMVANSGGRRARIRMPRARLRTPWLRRRYPARRTNESSRPGSSARTRPPAHRFRC
jgi:Zn-dependent protease with chaperone function